MPGTHPTDQQLIGFWCDPDFLKEIETARGTTPRSQFVRDAILEKLKRMGVEVPREKTIAPDRAGKGGRPRKDAKALYRRPPPKTLTSPGGQSTDAGVHLNEPKTGPKPTIVAPGGEATAKAGESALAAAKQKLRGHP